MVQPDLGVFGRGKSKIDYDRAAEEFAMRKRAAQMNEALVQRKLDAPAGGGADAPSSIREWNTFQQMQPDQQKQYLQMKRASQIMNLGGSQVVRDPMGGAPTESYQVTPKPEQMPEFKGKQQQAIKDVDFDMVPKTAAAKETAILDAKFKQGGKQNLIKQKKTIDSMRLQDDFIKSKANEVYAGIDGLFQTGFTGNVGGSIRGTKAYSLQSDIKTLTADSGINSLLEAKAKGATFGALQEKELDLLIALKGSLDQGLDASKLRSNLEQFMAQREKVFSLFEQQYQDDVVRFGGKQDLYQQGEQQFNQSKDPLGIR